MSFGADLRDTKKLAHLDDVTGGVDGLGVVGVEDVEEEGDAAGHQDVLGYCLGLLGQLADASEEAKATHVNEF